MFVFVCAGCGAELTDPLSQVALPVHAHQVYGNGAGLPVLMEAGTFAVGPDLDGGPWSWRESAEAGEAEARGGRAPVDAQAERLPGECVIAPGDIRGTRLNPERHSTACCGLDGARGPNLACTACSLPVATRIDDCSLWQAVWLSADAVRRVPVDDLDATPPTWEELVAAEETTPPCEPIATWGGRLFGTGHYWSWSPRWEAAAGNALAHLLVASRGKPVTVPGGLASEVFQRALDTLLPAGSPPRRAVLAGPGQPPPDADADILLVPIHPRTGRTWIPDGPTPSPDLVPLPLGAWLWLVDPHPYLPVPASGTVPREVLRDDPLPILPGCPFQVDRVTFDRALARLPAARSPWLRTIREDFARHTAPCFF